MLEQPPDGFHPGRRGARKESMKRKEQRERVMMMTTRTPRNGKRRRKCIKINWKL